MRLTTRSLLFVLIAFCLLAATARPAQAAPPPNDNLADAETITSLPFTDSQNNQDATAETDEAATSCGGTFDNGNSLWWEYTATSETPLIISTEGSDFDTLLSVWTGSGHPLTEENCGDDTGESLQSQLGVVAPAGVTLYIRVTASTAGPAQPLSGTIHLSVTQGSVPDNDNLADATNIPSVPFSDSASTFAATEETDEALGACDDESNSLWWQYTAPDDGALLVDTFGSEFDTILSVWTGADHPLLEVDCNDDEPNGISFQSQLVVPVKAGTTYFIRVTGFNGEEGAAVLNVDFAPRGADNLADAETINTVPYHATRSNLGATPETDEQAGTLGGCDETGDGGNSIWWQYTAQADGALAVDTFGSNFDTILSIWTSSGDPVTPGTLTELGCNDDEQNGFLTQSQLAVPVTAATTYFIRVTGFDGEGGAVALNVEAASPGADNVADAETITSLPYHAIRSNQTATLETDEEKHCFQPPDEGNSIWWRYTATENGAVVIDTIGSTFDTILSIWTDNTDPATHPMTLRYCNDDEYNGNYLQSQLALPVTAGTTYYIRVADYVGEGGVVVLNAEFAPDGADDVEDAPDITSRPFNTIVNNFGATSQADEPLASSSDCNFEGDLEDGGNSVWWRYTPSQNGALEVDTFGSTFDTILSIWTDDTDPAAHPMTEVDCSDDYEPNYETRYQSYLNIPVTAGTTYYIRVSGYELNTPALAATGTSKGATAKGARANAQRGTATGEEGGIVLHLNGPAPLAVTLAGFTATPGDDHILLQWETVSEQHNAGFRLYRGTDPQGAGTLLTDALIASEAPGSSEGYSYEWVDQQVQAGTTYYYWLEAVDLNGAASRFGPVSATVQVPTAVTMSDFGSRAASPLGWQWIALGLAALVVANHLRQKR
jgi:hypothetical protein